MTALPSSPSFQFYPKQWLGDDRVLLMDWDARAMHLHLMCISWQQPIVGSIPDDDATMRRWCGSPANSAWKRLRPQILSAWRLEGDRWYQDGLVRERARQIARREAGSKGGRPPAQTQEMEKLDETKPEHIANIAETNGEPNGKPHAGASSSPPSSSTSPDLPDGKSPPQPKKTRATPVVAVGPAFGDRLEPDVVAYLATAAAENESGKISDGREATLRRELAEKRAKVGDDAAFQHGLRAAINAGAGSANYVAKAAKSYRPMLDREPQERGRDYASADSVLADMAARK